MELFKDVRVFMHLFHDHMPSLLASELGIKLLLVAGCGEWPHLGPTMPNGTSGYSITIEYVSSFSRRRPSGRASVFHHTGKYPSLESSMRFSHHESSCVISLQSSLTPNKQV